MSIWRTDIAAVNDLADAMASCDASSGNANAAGCHEASTNMIAALRKLRDDLAGVDVPPRFADGDSKLKPALDAIVAALAVRNHGLETQDAAELRRGGDQLAAAGSDLRTAVALYPHDSGLALDVGS